MSIRDIIIKILREEKHQTETQYLGWDLPSGLYDELEDIGVKIWDKKSDKVYVAEIQFDTKSVVFEILTPQGETYFNTSNYAPSSYQSYYTIKLMDLPKRLRVYIQRRLEDDWIDTMDKFI